MSLKLPIPPFIIRKDKHHRDRPRRWWLGDVESGRVFEFETFEEAIESMSRRAKTKTRSVA